MNVNTIKNVVLENTRILFKNFRGEPTRFKPQGGERTFCVIVPEEQAIPMQQEGWNIKQMAPREDGDSPTYYLQVTARFGKFNPKVVMVNQRSRHLTPLSEDTVGCLDNAQVVSADVVIRPYTWEPGKIKAYLKTLYAVIAEDEFEYKYCPQGEPLEDEVLNIADDEIPF